MNAVVLFQLAGLVDDDQRQTEPEPTKRKRNQPEDDEQLVDTTRYRPQGRSFATASLLGGTLMIIALSMRFFSSNKGPASVDRHRDVKFHCDMRHDNLAYISPRAQTYFDQHCCVGETAIGGGTARQAVLQPKIQGGSPPPTSIPLVCKQTLYSIRQL